MKLSAWRIVKREHVSTAFTGDGASLYPGRWNSASVPVVYAAGSISLAILEVLVHAQDWKDPPDLCLIEIGFEDRLITAVAAEDLPHNWQHENATLKRTRRIGDDWFRQRLSAILKVPSAITGEQNFVLNPRHPDFGKIVIGKPTRLSLDDRLLPDSLRTRRRR